MTVHEDIVKHAEAGYPKEVCGLVIKSGKKTRYIPCTNESDSVDNFKISAMEYSLAEDQGEIVQIVHSHPDYPSSPSEADLVSCEESNIPWLIVSVREGKYADETLVKPTGYIAPLIGRMFYHGVLDCYTIIEDFYARELGIKLPHPDRDDDWWHKGLDLYMANYSDAGFEVVKAGSLQYGDVILMQIRSPVANHGAVYIGENEIKESPGLHRVPNAMLHHLHGRLSERAVYGGHYLDSTRAILRHKEINDRSGKDN